MVMGVKGVGNVLSRPAGGGRKNKGQRAGWGCGVVAPVMGKHRIMYGGVVKGK